MTMQTYDFYKKDNLPTVEELQSAIAKNGFNYRLPEAMTLIDKNPVLIKGSFEGLESCFDYVLDPYEDDDWQWTEDDTQLLDGADVVSVFNTYSNAQEIVGMLVVSSVLTKLTNGVMLSDFFDDELITSAECIDFAKEIIEGSREQFSGPSAMRG